MINMISSIWNGLWQVPKFGKVVVPKSIISRTSWEWWYIPRDPGGQERHSWAQYHLPQPGYKNWHTTPLKFNISLDVRWIQRNYFASQLIDPLDTPRTISAFLCFPGLWLIKFQASMQYFLRINYTQHPLPTRCLCATNGNFGALTSGVFATKKV